MTFQIVLPRRSGRVLKVRDEDVGPGIQRVDNHLPFNRPGDFNAPVLPVLRKRRDGSILGADLGRLLEKIWHPSLTYLLLPDFPVFEKRLPAVLEFARQLGE